MLYGRTWYFTSSAKMLIVQTVLRSMSFANERIARSTCGLLSHWKSSQYTVVKPSILSSEPA